MKTALINAYLKNAACHHYILACISHSKVYAAFTDERAVSRAPILIRRPTASLASATKGQPLRTPLRNTPKSSSLSVLRKQFMQEQSALMLKIRTTVTPLKVCSLKNMVSRGSTLEINLFGKVRISRLTA